MTDFNYDSYCGIYCGACDIMMTYKTGNSYRLALFWNEATVKSLQKGLGLKYDESQPFKIECHGCKSDLQFVNCRVCKIRDCAVSRKIEHCIDCENYPCNLTAGMKKNEFSLPHTKENHPNMMTIKQAGVDQWLSEQAKKWKCPECTTNFSWYTSSCTNCGSNLDKYSFKFTSFHFILMKIEIFLIPYLHRNK